MRRRNLLRKITAVCIGVAVSRVAAELRLRIRSFVKQGHFSNRTPWNPILLPE